MTVTKEDRPFQDISIIREPEELEYIVTSKNDKRLYFALEQIKFTYKSLVRYLHRNFYSDSGSIRKAQSLFLSDLMGISESTFHRWKKSDKQVEEKYAERLTELIQLFLHGEEVFESRKAFLEWLSVPNIHLEGKPPIEHLDKSSGLRYVTHLLDKIEYGAPV